MSVDPDTELAACVGTKEFVASTAQYLRLRTPGRDTVLYPAVSYPTYAMGALLGGCRPVPVAELPGGGPRPRRRSTPADVDRALLLWVNTPVQPDRGPDRPGPGGRGGGGPHGVPVFSDECYAEFTWDGPPATVLASGMEGVVAVHSLSKRSNLAGVRAGFYAGDPDLVGYLLEVRKHAGLMVPGPVQAAAVVALRRRRPRGSSSGAATGSGWPSWPGCWPARASPAALPAGGFYLWVPVPDRFAGDGAAGAWA